MFWIFVYLGSPKMPLVSRCSIFQNLSQKAEVSFICSMFLELEGKAQIKNSMCLFDLFVMNNSDSTNQEALKKKA